VLQPMWRTRGSDALACTWTNVRVGAALWRCVHASSHTGAGVRACVTVPVVRLGYVPTLGSTCADACVHADTTAAVRAAGPSLTRVWDVARSYGAARVWATGVVSTACLARRAGVVGMASLACGTP
jgi:hypothetical protein